MPENSARLRPARVGRARDCSLVPGERSRTRGAGHAPTRSRPTRAPRRRGPEGGARLVLCGVPERELQCAARRRPEGGRRARLRHCVLRRLAEEAACARSSASIRPRAARDRAALQQSSASASSSPRPRGDVPLPTRRSTSSSPSTAPRSGRPVQVDPQAARLLRPGGELVFLLNWMLADPLLARDEDLRPART